jgi:hypothetical protein
MELASEDSIMSENPPNPSTSSSEFPPSEGWPDYPGFGSKEDVIARMKLLDWLYSQIGVTIHPEVGDYVLATDGRILGFGPDGDELERQLLAAEPGLRNARVVQYRIPPREW